MQQSLRLELQRLRRHVGARGGWRASAPRSRTLRPRFALASAWPQLSRAELRLLMARLLDLEVSSAPGPVRSRFRARRAAAVSTFRRVHGELADNAAWVAPDAARGRRLAPALPRARSTARLHGWQLFTPAAL